MTKQTRLLLLVFSCLLSNISAQPNYTALLHKPYEQRCRLLDSLFYPVTDHFDIPAFTQKLQQVAALARQEGDKELYLEMEYRRLRFASNRMPNAVVEKEIRELVQQAKDKQYRQLEIRAIVLLALRQHIVYNNVWASIELYMNARHLMQEVPTAQFPDKRDYLYSDLAFIYYSLEDYENTKTILLEAVSLPYYPVPAWIKLSEQYHFYNTLGLAYRSLAQYDSTLLYFKKNYAYALNHGDSLWIGITNGNIGITYFLQKRYTEAIPLLENDVQQSFRFQEYGNAANSLLKLVAINLSRGNQSFARQQMPRIRAALAIEQKRYDVDTRLDNYYQLVSRLYVMQGNFPLAYRYSDSTRQIQDTIFRKKRAVILARAQQKTDNEHLKLEVEKLEHQQRTQTLVRNSLLCMLALSGVITLLLISRQRLLKKQKQFAEARRMHTRKELEDARRQLQNFTHNIREKNELIERLNAEMVDLQNNLSKETIDYRQTTLEQLRRQTILTDAEWETFKASFEKVYPGWFAGIGIKLPGLSAADLRFMALSKLKLNNREMSSVLGISAGAVRMSRHRIRKKYNLTDEESLELLAEEV